VIRGDHGPSRQHRDPRLLARVDADDRSTVALPEPAEGLLDAVADAVGGGGDVLDRLVTEAQAVVGRRDDDRRAFGEVGARLAGGERRAALAEFGDDDVPVYCDTGDGDWNEYTLGELIPDTITPGTLGIDPDAED
jgi:hypothetical protein